MQLQNHFFKKRKTRFPSSLPFGMKPRKLVPNFNMKITESVLGSFVVTNNVFSVSIMKTALF